MLEKKPILKKLATGHLPLATKLVTVDEFFADKEFCYLSIFSLAERESVQVGQHVKLIFKIEDGIEGVEEKLWVEVSWAENGYYIGKLLDGSNRTENLSAGDSIDFSFEHIIMIW